VSGERERRPRAVPSIFTLAAVEACLARWQGVLRLADWDIRAQIAPAGWRKSGDVKIDLEDRKAILLVNEGPRCENLDELVVHELLHIKLYVLDRMVEDLLSAVYGEDDADPKRSFAHAQFMRVLEATVEDLAKTCLAASGGQPRALSFGRLADEVKRETEGGV
jgi:hypothetical protein